MRTKIIVALSLVLSALGLAACGGHQAQKLSGKVIRQDVGDISSQVQELRRNEPLPRFHDSAALHVQDAYYTADADPHKTWYVTIVTINGQVLEHFTTQGAPQPAGDQVTNPLQLTCQTFPGSAPNGCGTVGLPEPNGVHQGTGNDGYVAILTTGAVKRFSCGGVYCDISDQPLDVKSQPLLTVNENAPLSFTDTAKTTGAVVPRGTSTRAGK